MYSTDNKVTLAKIESDSIPTKLATAYPVGSTAAISVENAGIFTNYENVGVGTTNVGLLRI